ncbi:MAG: Eco47II family restriction endonuclease [Saccharofermentanales bacterium]
MIWDLEFISRDQYVGHVKEFFEGILNSSYAADLNEFNRNIIDPIKLTFQYFASNRDKNQIVLSEIIRQQDKSINNAIGYFHQKLFGYIDGWIVPNSGFDVISEYRHIYAEIKNKHNTMNSSSATRIYRRMQEKILQDDQATCFLVEVIASRSQDIPWAISTGRERFCHERIRRISIDNFYEIVTGDPFAFKKIIEWLPITIRQMDIVQDSGAAENNIVKGLEADGPFFRELYKLAFSDYRGFDEFIFRDDETLGLDFSWDRERQNSYE